MADNKGSSSNPTKGLVNHLDRNRNLQQDRTVASSSAPAIVSIPCHEIENESQLTVSHQPFRSQPHSHSAASAEANFNNFTNAATQPGALPLRPASQQPSPFRPDFSRAWLSEFSRLNDREVFQDPRTMASPMRAGAQAVANQGQATHDAVHRAAAYRAAASSGPGDYQNGGPVQVPVFRTRLTVQHPGAYQNGVATQGPVFQSVEEAQAMAENGQRLATHQYRMQQLGGVVPAPEQYNIYPEQVLADNPGQAMEAAFAAYDQEFQDEMDSWMGTHGPEDREDHVQNMEELIAVNAVRDAVHGPLNGNAVNKTKMGPSLNPAIPGSDINVYEEQMKNHYRVNDVVGSREETLPKQALLEDAELKKHASQILGTLGSEGSTETKEKLKASSFVGLMKAIASGKAVLQGEAFVDASSGKVIEDWDVLGNGNTITDESKVEGKGKGKMNNLEEQAKEQHETGGGTPGTS